MYDFPTQMIKQSDTRTISNITFSIQNLFEEFMAFSQPNSRELQNRKILEELQLKKQMLLKQGVAPTLTTPLNLPSTSSAPTPSTSLPDGSMSAAQRNALNSAHAQSFGFFVTQDSSFGNLILPVLPRFDAK